VDDISLDLLPANLDLDLDDACVPDHAADDSGTDTGGPEALQVKPPADPVLSRAAEVMLQVT